MNGEKVLFDTNVILDVLFDRGEHAKDSSKVLTLAARGILQGSIAAHSIATLAYIVEKEKGTAKVRETIRELLSFLAVATIDGQVIQGAIESKFHDMEDGMVYFAAEKEGATKIITRDVKGFTAGKIKAVTPTVFFEGFVIGK